MELSNEAIKKLIGELEVSFNFDPSEWPMKLFVQVENKYQLVEIHKFVTLHRNESL